MCRESRAIVWHARGEAESAFVRAARRGDRGGCGRRGEGSENWLEPEVRAWMARARKKSSLSIKGPKPTLARADGMGDHEAIANPRLALARTAIIARKLFCKIAVFTFCGSPSLRAQAASMRSSPVAEDHQ